MNAKMPDELAAALEEHPEARQLFDGLAPSHKAEYVTWIEEAKKAETRERRVAKTLEMLQEGNER